MAKTTIRIPKDKKHRIVIPNEIWEVEKLHEGDLIEVDLTKINRTPEWKKMSQLPEP